MNKLISTTAAFAAGLLTMYFFDGQSGRRRRALLRDKTVSGARTALHRGRQEARHMANQAKGLLATRRLDRHSPRPPQDDHQLHERIRAALGHVVSHPGAIHVKVDHGEVTLGGHVLRHEITRLLQTLREMPGVTRLDNQLAEHEEAGHIAALQGNGRPAGAEPPHPATAWH